MDLIEVFVKILKYVDINLKNISMYEKDLNVFSNKEIYNIIMFSEKNINEVLEIEDIVKNKEEQKFISLYQGFEFPETEEELIKNKKSYFFEKMKKMTTISSLILFVNKLQNKQEEYIESYNVLEENYNNLKEIGEIAYELQIKKEEEEQLQKNTEELIKTYKKLGIKIDGR